MIKIIGGSGFISTRLSKRLFLIVNFKSEITGEFNTKFAQLETKFEHAQVKMQETITTPTK